MATVKIGCAPKALNTDVGSNSPRGFQIRSTSSDVDHNINNWTGRYPSTGTSINTSQFIETDDMNTINQLGQDEFYPVSWENGDIYGSTINSATLYVSHEWINYNNDTAEVSINFVDRSGADLGTTANLTGNTNGQEVTSISLTGLDWADIGGGAILDGAQDQDAGFVALRSWNHSASMGNDGVSFRVYAIWIEIDYTPTAAAADYPNPVDFNAILGMQGGAGRSYTIDTTTAAAGSSRLLIAWMSEDSATSPGTPTYDSNNMTALQTGIDGADAARQWMHVYYYDIPDADTGNKTLQFPASGATTPGDHRCGYVVFENVKAGGPVFETTKTSVSSNTSILLDRSQSSPNGISGEGLGLVIGIGATQHDGDVNPLGLNARGSLSEIYLQRDAENAGSTLDWFQPYGNLFADYEFGVLGWALDDESLSATSERIYVSSSSTETDWDFHVAWFPMKLLDQTIAVPLNGPARDDMDVGTNNTDLATDANWIRAEGSSSETIHFLNPTILNSPYSTAIYNRRNTGAAGATGSYMYAPSGVPLQGDFAELRVWAKAGDGTQTPADLGPAVRLGDNATHGDGYWCYLDNETNGDPEQFWTRAVLDGTGIAQQVFDISSLNIPRNSPDGTVVGLKAFTNASNQVELTVIVNRTIVAGTYTDTTPETVHLTDKGVGVWGRVYSASAGELTEGNEWQGGSPGLQLQGYPPKINPIDPVIVPAGSLTLTGQAPTINVGLLLQIPTATLSLTGLAPAAGASVTRNFTLNPETGWAYVDIASLNTTDPESIAGPNGILNGLLANGDQVHYQTTTETNGTAISLAATGIWTTTEDDDTWELRMWDATDSKWDSFVFQTLSAGTTVDVPVGSLTLTGLAPSAEVSVSASPPTASMTLTGLAPTVLTPRLVDVPQASLTLTGLAPTALTPRLEDVPTASLTLTGLAPSAEIDVLVDVPTVALALTGFAPTVLTPPIPAYVRNANSGGTNTVNIDVDSPNGKKRVLLVFTGRENASQSALTGVDVGGQAMTKLGETASTTLDFEVWGADEAQLAGQSGSRAVTLQGSSAGHGFLAVLFEGIEDATVMALDFFTSDVSGTNFDHQASSLADGLVALCVMGTDNQTTGTYTAPLTERYDAFNQAVSNVTMALASGVETTETTEKEYDATAGGNHAERVGVVLTFAPQNTIVSQPPTAALALTGQAPEIDLSWLQIVPTGTLTLTGLAPTVINAITVDVPTATLTLTGLAPSPEIDVLVDVPTVAMTLTGQAPTLDLAVDVPTGSLAFTGLAPEVFTPRLVDVPTATMTLTGLAPTVLTPRTVDVPAGSLALTGYPPVLPIIVPTGSLTLTGLAPSAEIDVVIDVPTVAMTLTGLAPDIALTVDVPTGSLTLTGLAPEVFTPVIVDVPTGSLTLTGFAPSPEIDVLVDVPTVAMTLTGLAPEVQLSFLQDIPTGSLTLTGLAPVIALDIDVPTGALVLTGFAPEVALPVVVEVPISQNVGAPTFEDDFNRANQSLQTSADWTLVSGSASSIVSNELAITSFSLNHVVGVTSNAVEWRHVSGQGSGVLRSIDAGDQGIYFEALTFSGNDILTWRIRANNNAISSTVTFTIAEGDIIRLKTENKDGGIEVVTSVNGTVRDTSSTVNHSQLEDIGNVGIYSRTGTGVIDDFTILNTATLVMTGYAPVLDLAIDVPTASLTLTGYEPFVIPVVPTATMTLTGQVPIILTGDNQTVEPPTATMTLTGLAPEVDLSWLQVIPAGSLSLTGQIPEILTPRTVDVPTASLTLTGLAPTVLAPRLVDIPTASLTLTGLVPDALTPRTVDVPTGALTLTGLAPSLDLAVDVPAGALTLTGLAPVVTTENDVTVEVPTSSLSLTGLAPIIDLAVDVPTGALTLSGLAPEIQLSWLQDIPAGVLTLTGLAPQANLAVDVPTGTLTLTGLAPETLTPRLVDVPTQALTLTGLAPDVFTPRLVDVPAGALTLTGLAPEVQVAITVDVPTGALTLAGQTPSLDLAVNVPVGALTLTGLQPFAITPRTVDVPTGSLTLTGLAPNVVSGTIIDVPTAALTLTGLEPSVELSWLQVIPVGSLSITGLEPTIAVSNNITVDVPTASITLTGLPPTALTPTAVDVPTGTLSLTGLAPAVDISVAPITIPTGALTLTGLAPDPFVSADRTVDVPTGALVLTGFAPSVESSFVEVPTAVMSLTGLAPQLRYARDYGAQITYKRVFNADVGNPRRVYTVPPDEEMEAR